MNYLMHLLIMLCFYAMLGQSLNLLVGYGGLLSLSHAALYGLGAYAAALLSANCGIPFILALPACVVAAMMVSAIVALPSLRLKGDFFVLATLGFQMIACAIALNWVGMTNGPYGITGIVRPTLFGLAFTSLPSFLGLVAVLTAIVLFVQMRIARSPFCRTLQAVRDDEIAAASLGKNTLFFKVAAFMMAGGVAALVGALYGVYVSFIDPTSFTIDESIFILSIVIIGGAGNVVGPFVGALVMVLLPEALRFARIPDSLAPNVRQIALGLLLIVLMRFRPQGIAGNYEFD